jgi:hypothetical protein
VTAVTGEGLLVLSRLGLAARAVRSGAPGAWAGRGGAPGRARDARAVAVTGACAALTADLAPGHLVVASEIRAPGRTIACPSAPLLAGVLRRRGFTVHCGPVVSTARSLRRAERARHRAAGAIAVDLGSPWLAAASGDRPLAVVRAVVAAPASDSPLAVAAAVGAALVELDELLESSDYVVVQAPLTDETRNLFDRDAIARMKRGAILVNTARGPIVDGAALYDALVEGRLAGAALDDLPEEPAKQLDWRPDNPLLTLPNCLVTPHAAYYSEESIRYARTFAAEEVVRVLRGEPPRSPVNLDRLARATAVAAGHREEGASR